MIKKGERMLPLFLTLCAPHVGAQLPHPQKGGRSAPPPRGSISQCEGLRPSALPTWEHSSHTLRREGAPPLRPRVTFPSRGKSPKARQGLRPLESRQCEETALFGASLRLHPGYFLPLKKTDLPLLGCGQIGLLFSPNLIEETPSIFNPWRGG